MSGLTPADAVGGTLPTSVLDTEQFSRDDIVEIVRDKHYTNGPRSSRVKAVLDVLIRERIENEFVTPDEAVDVLVEYYWEKRHSLSHHDIFQNIGFDLVEPFRAPEFYEPYSRIPVELQYDRRMLEAYTEQLNEELLDGLQIGKPTHKPSTLQRVKRTIGDSPLGPVARPIKGWVDARLEGSFDPEEFRQSNPKFGFMSTDRLASEYSGEEHYRYFLATDEITRSRLRPDGSYVSLPS